MCLAIPGKIVELVSGQDQVGVVEVAGVRRKVQLGLLAEDLPIVGDWVLIHVGFAMSKISETDAADQMRLLAMLGEHEQAMDEVRGYGMEDTAHPTADREALNAESVPAIPSAEN
jgi:hydrogenase expression/formation protein HypC